MDEALRTFLTGASDGYNLLCSYTGNDSTMLVVDRSGRIAGRLQGTRQARLYRNLLLEKVGEALRITPLEAVLKKAQQEVLSEQ